MKKLLFAVFTLLTCQVFAQNVQKNGTIYKEHPYIDAVNNATAFFLKGDWDSYAALYADSAKFYDPSSKKPMTLADEKNGWVAIKKYWKNVKVTKEGYPDALEYDKDPFTVQSWWTIDVVNRKTNKHAKVHMVQFDTFNKDGKIATEVSYYDQTPFTNAEKPTMSMKKKK